MNNEELLQFVIFGSDHYNTLGAVRSLGEMGIRPDLILHPNYSKYPHLANNSKYAGRVKLVNNANEGFQYLLDHYSHLATKAIVISCDDWVESILDLHYDQIKDRFVFFHGKEQGIVSHFMDKENVKKLAIECGLTAARAERVKRGTLPQTLHYPVITKSVLSTEGGWKGDVHICYSAEELQEAYEKISSEELLIEEYIEKEYEFSYNGYAADNGDICVMPYLIKNLRVLKGTFGSYLEYESSGKQYELDCIRKMMKTIGYSGVFSADFLKGIDGKIYFMEINFRNSAFSYPVTFGGCNLIGLWTNSQNIKCLPPLCVKYTRDSEPWWSRVILRIAC